MSPDRPTMPPVRLPSEAELARDALSAPLFARAVRLARWAAAGIPVGGDGALPDAALREAAADLGFGDTEGGADQIAAAWRLAVDTGLVEIGESSGGTSGGPAAADVPSGVATPGEEAALVTTGSPHDVLDIWLGGLETLLCDATVRDLSRGAETGEDVTGGGPDWDASAEADFLDRVLENLYLLTVLDNGPNQRAVPLPALAASVIVPDDMDEPTDEVLEEVSEAMMRLDGQFRLLAPHGLVDYQPVDEKLIEDLDEQGDPPGGAPAAEEDVSRYGMVRLTPLGVYGVRARMLEAGTDAPAVGDLADKGADVLLDRLPGYPETAAQAEVEQWLHRRPPEAAARELLAAGRGDDDGAPLRRLSCQQALSLIGPEAEAAVREVLDDRHLGGLARVWLAERGVDGVPEPPEEMVFWLTVDTIAAQLAAEGDSGELEGLVQGLVSGHSGFFDAVWRVDHPATADVLEAMGRLHPDRKLAKDARKAAFKARSRVRG